MKRTSRNKKVTAIIAAVTSIAICAGMSYAWFVDQTAPLNANIQAARINVDLEKRADALTFGVNVDGAEVLPGESLWLKGNHLINDSTRNAVLKVSVQLDEVHYDRQVRTATTDVPVLNSDGTAVTDATGTVTQTIYVDEERYLTTNSTTTTDAKGNPVVKPAAYNFNSVPSGTTNGEQAYQTALTAYPTPAATRLDKLVQGVKTQILDGLTKAIVTNMANAGYDTAWVKSKALSNTAGDVIAPQKSSAYIALAPGATDVSFDTVSVLFPAGVGGNLKDTLNRGSVPEQYIDLGTIDGSSPSAVGDQGYDFNRIDRTGVNNDISGTSLPEGDFWREYYPNAATVLPLTEYPYTVTYGGVNEQETIIRFTVKIEVVQGTKEAITDYYPNDKDNIIAILGIAANDSVVPVVPVVSPTTVTFAPSVTTTSSPVVIGDYGWVTGGTPADPVTSTAAVVGTITGSVPTNFAFLTQY